MTYMRRYIEKFGTPPRCKMPVKTGDDGYPICPLCAQPVHEIRDELSMREWQISGMCQRCQDSVFTPKGHSE